MGVMSSYNDWDGVPVSASYYFLTELLREEYGFDGYVVSDSEAVEFVESKHHVADTYDEAVRQVLEAGLNVRTHFTPPSDFILPIRRLLEEKKISMAVIDKRVSEVLRVKFRLGLFDQPYVADTKAADRVGGADRNMDFVKQMQQQALVLLKNENALLPLAEGAKVAVIGDFAQTPRYQGAGSSAVNSIKVDTFLDCLKESGLASVGFAPGFDRQGRPVDARKAEAVALARKADTVLLCLGLDEIKESEGIDRSDMKLAVNQLDLLEAISRVNPNVVVVLSAGASLETPWLKNCRALVYGALGGQAGAGAIMDVLTGRGNPSGKLAETWVNAYADTPAKDNFAGPGRMVQYREGLYVGYRYYQTAGVPVAFPFGYGLSYTSFAYSNLQAAANGVTLTVTNTGKRAGAEIVQLYVAKPGAEVFRHSQELNVLSKMQHNTD